MWSFFPVRSPGDFKALRTSDVPAISLLASCLLAHRFYAAWRTSCAPEISKNETSFFAITVTTSNSEFAVNKALYIYITSTITSYIWHQQTVLFPKTWEALRVGAMPAPEMRPSEYENILRQDRSRPGRNGCLNTKHADHGG
jgi:hypothetical protein